jgi:hypothetical protein
MMFASMIEIVIMPRFGTGANASPLTAEAPMGASSRPAAATVDHDVPPIERLVIHNRAFSDEVPERTFAG